MIDIVVIAELIERCQQEKKSALKIARLVKELVNFEWYGKKRHANETIIEEGFIIFDKEWRMYCDVRSEGCTRVQAEDYMRGYREIDDEML